MNAMNTVKMGMVLAALVLALDVQVAAAQSPSITVSNQQSKGTRRVEIVIQDPLSGNETSPVMMPETNEMLTPPDGGQIQGTMISGGKHFAVTSTRMLGVGDKVAGHTIAQVSLDRVVISRGASTYELDLTSGSWSAADASAAE